MQPRHEDPIWPSYADLMTSLFGVALVLFVLSYWLLTVRYKMSAEKWQKVQEVEQSVSELADEKYFVYQKEYKRHVLHQNVQFARGHAEIPEDYKPYLKAAGERIARLIADLRSRSTVDIKYLIIIEGMASNDQYSQNYPLSYARALSLYRLWGELGIKFDPNVCEVIIAGSGTGGVGRYSAGEEAKNQRFLIQILPKVGAEGWASERSPSAPALKTATR